MAAKMSMKIVVVVMVVAMAWLGAPATAATSGSTPPPACLASISDSCNVTDSGDTTAQLDQCCTALTDAIDNQRKCFCLLKPYLDDSSSSDAIATLFTYCSIDGSFDTLCSTTDGSTSPSGDDTSPSEDTKTTPSSNSNTSGGLGGGILGQGNKNASNKMATTSLSSLLIIFISMVIMHGI